MLTLHNKDFTTKYGTINTTIEAFVEEERNGLFELSFIMLNTDSLFNYVKEDNIVVVNANDTLLNQKFRIYMTRKLMNNRLEVFARHISFDLMYDYIDSVKFENQSCEYALNMLFRNSNFSKHYKGYSDIINAQDYNMSMANILEAIGGKEGSIIDTFGTGAELLRDNENIHVLNKRGHDNSVSIEYKKNLTGFELEEDTTELITRILPYAKYNDEEGNEITVKTNYVDSSLIANYSHPFIKAIDYSDKFDDENIPTADKLKALAELEYKNNKVDKPKQNFKIEFIPLSKCVGYEGLEDSVGLCDTVTIKDTRYNINTKAKIIKVVFNVLKNRYESIEIGEPRTTLGDIINNTTSDITTEDVKDIVNNTPSINFPNTLPKTSVLSGKSVGLASIELEWTFENKAYYSYELYGSKEKDFTPNSSNLIQKGQISSFLYQAKPNETWHFKVCAINSRGNRNNFSNQVTVSTAKVNAEEWIEEATIGNALIGNLSADKINAGTLRGNYIDAKNLSVTNGNGKRTLDIDSYGNVSLDVASLKISSSSVATENYANTKATQALNDSKTYTTTQITTTNNKVASIETNLNSITSRVSNVETKQTTANNNIASLTTRMNTAESKITSSAIINTVSSTIDDKVNSAINTAKSEIKQTTDSIQSTVTNINNNYASKSQLTQTVNDFEYKFQQSCANLLYNSSGRSGTIAPWWHFGYENGYGSTSSVVNNEWTGYEGGFCIRQYTAHSRTDIGIAQTVTVTPNRQHTLIVYVAGHRCGINVGVTTANNDAWVVRGADLGACHGGTNLSNWHKVTLHFTPTESQVHVRITMTNSAGGDAYLWMKRAMLVEGILRDIEWSPNPSEVMNNVTNISGEGISVSHDDGSTSKMTNREFYATNQNGIKTFSTRRGGLWGYNVDNGSANYAITTTKMKSSGAKGMSITLSQNNASYLSMGSSDVFANDESSISSSPNMIIVAKPYDDTVLGSTIGTHFINKSVHTWMPSYLHSTLSIDSGTDYYHLIANMTGNKLGLYGDNGVNIGVKVGDSLISNFTLTEDSSNAYGYFNVYGNWYFNNYTAYNLKTANSLEAQSQRLRNYQAKNKEFNNLYSSFSFYDNEFTYTNTTSRIIPYGEFELLIEIPQILSENMQNEYYVNISKNSFGDYRIKEKNNYYFIVETDRVEDFSFTYQIVGNLIEKARNNIVIANNSINIDSEDIKEPVKLTIENEINKDLIK